MAFRWPIFFVVIYGFLFCLVVCGQSTSCKGAISQDPPACTENLGFITGDLLSEKTIGYLPYKPVSGDGNETAPNGSSKRHLRRGLDYQRGDKAKQESAGAGPVCPAGKKSCANLGHPEICCEESHTCLPTNNTLTGTYCCRSTDPVKQPCNDDHLTCENGWYECPAISNGGCCKYGQRCGLLQCFEGGGPASPTSTPTPSVPVLPDPDADGDGVTGTQDNTSALRTTIPYSASKPSTTPAPGNGAMNETGTNFYRITGVLSSTPPATPFTPRPTFNPGPPTSTKPSLPTNTGQSEGRKNSLEYRGWIGVVIFGWVAVIAGNL